MLHGARNVRPKGRVSIAFCLLLCWALLSAGCTATPIHLPMADGGTVIMDTGALSDAGATSFDGGMNGDFDAAEFTDMATADDSGQAGPDAGMGDGMVVGDGMIGDGLVGDGFIGDGFTGDGLPGDVSTGDTLSGDSLAMDALAPDAELFEAGNADL